MGSASDKILHTDIAEEGFIRNYSLKELHELIESVAVAEVAFAKLAKTMNTNLKGAVISDNDLQRAKQIEDSLKRIDDLEKANTEVKKQKIAAEIALEKLEREKIKNLIELERLEKAKITTDSAALTLQQKIEKQTKAQTAAVENSTSALRKMTRELANLPAGSKEFNELAKKAGLLKDKIGDAKDAVKAFSSESKLTNAKTLFGQIGDDLRNMNFGDAADKARLFSGVIKSMSFADVIGGIKNFGSAMASMASSLLLNPFTLTIAAIVALGLAIKETFDAYGRADKIVAALNERLKEQDKITRQIIESTKELNRQNQVERGEITEAQKKRMDDEDKFREKFIGNRQAERKEIAEVRKQFDEANKKTYTEMALGDIGRALHQKRVIDNTIKEGMAIAEIKKKYGETALALQNNFSTQLISVDIKEGNEKLKVLKKSNEELQKERDKHNKELLSAKNKMLQESSEEGLDADKSIEKSAQAIQDKDKKNVEEQTNRWNNWWAWKKKGDDASAEQQKKSAESAAAFEQKVMEERIERATQMAKSITEGIAEGLDKKAEIQSDANQREIDMQNRMIDIQAGLAASGADNVLAETIAQADKAEQKKIDDDRKAAKQQELIAEIQTFTSVLSAALKSDKPFFQALGEAGAASGIVKMAFSKLFAGTAYEGTEDTGSAGNLDGKGGKAWILHPNERVLTKEQNQKLGGISNNELVDNFENMYNPQYNSANSSSTAIRTTSHDEQLAKIFENKIDDLKKTIENKPAQNVSLARLGEWDEQIQQGITTTIIHHKKNTKRPSLRLNS